MQPISLEAQAVTEEATQETVEQVTQEQDASKEGQMEAELILLEEEEALVEAENEGAEAQEQLPLIQAEEPTGPVVLQASLPGSDYVVVVRFDASSGIPLDAQLIVSQILTLFTTPVVYLYLDELNNWFSTWGRSADGESDEAPAHGNVKEAAE